jgi:hypothetical protein
MIKFKLPQDFMDSLFWPESIDLKPNDSSNWKIILWKPTLKSKSENSKPIKKKRWRPKKLKSYLKDIFDLERINDILCQTNPHKVNGTPII